MLVSWQSQLVVVIENKIRSDEHGNQLYNYRLAVEKAYPDPWTRRFLFLSPDGATPKDLLWKPIGYDAVRSTLNALLFSPLADLSPAVRLVLDHYKALLETHVINDPELDELCDQILRKHGPALRLVFERMSSPHDIVAQTVHAWMDDNQKTLLPDLRQKALIRFLPKDWADFSPKISLNGETPRHTLTVLVDNRKGASRLSIELYGVDEEKRKVLRNIALRNNEVFPGLSAGTGKTFATLYSVPLLALSDLNTIDSEELALMVRERLDGYLTNVVPKQTEAFRAVLRISANEEIQQA